MKIEVRAAFWLHLDFLQARAGCGRTAREECSRVRREDVRIIDLRRHTPILLSEPENCPAVARAEFVIDTPRHPFWAAEFFRLPKRPRRCPRLNILWLGTQRLTETDHFRILHGESFAQDPGAWNVRNSIDTNGVRRLRKREPR